MTFELKPFRIGPIEVPLPVVLAPLAGYSDLPYRIICRRLGAKYCATEMMLDKMVLIMGRLHNRMMATTEEDHPIAGQLIGNTPDEMVKAAEELCRKGFDVVDLNFACPVRKALSRKRGGFMLTQVDLCAEILRAVVKAVDRPVTLKIRQKFKKAHDTEAFFAIADAAFAAGISSLCVHARSVEIKYAGRADWDFLAAVKQRYADKTIMGSGDILRPQAAIDMIQHTGVDAVAVARGGLGNPWFFRQVQDLAAGREMYRPTIAEQREVMERHFAHAIELYGPLKGPKIMRKFGIKYARMHPTPSKLRVAFVAVKRPQQWQEVLDKYYTDEYEKGSHERTAETD